MNNRLLAIVLCCVINIPAQAQAANQNECAIWLCLPFGFALPGCSAPRSAMLQRLFEFKGPAPAFSSCEASNSTNPNTYQMSTGKAVLMAAGNLGADKIIDGGFCNFRDSGHEEPLGCAGTLRMYKLYENGLQMGMTYYYNPQGSDYVRDPETGLISRVSSLLD